MTQAGCRFWIEKPQDILNENVPHHCHDDLRRWCDERFTWRAFERAHACVHQHMYQKSHARTPKRIRRAEPDLRDKKPNNNPGEMAGVAVLQLTLEHGKHGVQDVQPLVDLDIQTEEFRCSVLENTQVGK